MALSTLGLAFFTAFLAWSTRGLAREARRETRANWRPVIVLETHSTSGGTSPVVFFHDGTLSITIHNVGRGPAIHVRATLNEHHRPGSPGDSVIGPDDWMTIVWREFEPPQPPADALPTWQHVIGAVEFYDVSYTQYSTSFVLGFQIPDRIALVNQHLEPEQELSTPWVMRLPVRIREPILSRLVDREIRRLDAQEARDLGERSDL